MMACNPLIFDPVLFPRRAFNRPGLPRIDYRIGRYPDFLAAMIRGIDAAPELAAWTHREADDPAIALLEGAAILGDILTFYQEHYANEAYLRTAAWRDSVAELVRLTGYRLSPAIRGRATLAFEARGDKPVPIAAGFPVKVELEDLPLPADFQTDTPLEAWPHLGRFHLYRPRAYAATLAAGTFAFEVSSVAGAADSASLAAFELKPGDRLMLLPPEPPWTSNSGVPVNQASAQVVKVKTVTRLLGRLLVEAETPILRQWTAPVAAYRINRTFRHLGHNAPLKTVGTTPASGTITGATQYDTRYQRHLTWECTDTEASLDLPPELFPLDVEVADLHPGGSLVIQTRISRDDGTPVTVSLLRGVTAVEFRTIGFGNVNGPGTLLTLDRPLVDETIAYSYTSDVRDFRLHEVTSPALRLQPVTHGRNGGFTPTHDTLHFYGTAAQARLLAGRRLFLAHGDGRSVELACTSAASEFPTLAVDPPAMWPLVFDRLPAPFRHADFDETAPAVTVFGNLVDASQGKAEGDVVLGNGDGRQSWQTFAIPKAPLSYFLSSDGVPPWAPALQIYVDGRLWRRVDAFFGHGPQEQAYIVREDAEGRSFVQFGDGQAGARLPSGLGNVMARYRSGAGARGPLKPDTKPTTAERPPGFDKVTLAGIVSGGADAEDAGKAREAAPGKVQSLGRLVSIRDYETETLGVPGVVTAAAAWDLHVGVPALILRVLLEAGREGEFAAVRATLARAQRCRGPDRFPLVVQQALLRYVFVDVGYARDPSWRQEDVEAALRAALGLAGDPAAERTGLFGLRARRLGEREYASRIEGRLQNVPGVLWCRVTALGRFPPNATGPEALPLPPAPRPAGLVLPCGARELLQLAPSHLTLTALAEPSAGECA
ncbi:hypothetical protein [Pseudoduganella albidiflava]|uniref:Baseplate assembly protein n=2 Tax=Pseudoduganella albidiflava TaxID=321983 RepID=A0ABX5RT05_9BURK|nr:hypothetical protein [Pseudoduganella albidiflava]QBI01738.1 hypothetical protein EYF70_13420 [Pseudoduganella albidiflava]